MSALEALQQLADDGDVAARQRHRDAMEVARWEAAVAVEVTAVAARRLLAMA